MTFMVGQKVTWVPPEGSTLKWLSTVLKIPTTERQPELGIVYTIRAIVDCQVCSDGVFGLLFVEITNPLMDCGSVFGLLEPMFDSREFRRVVERKTDISIFTKMLNQSDKRVNA